MRPWLLYILVVLLFASCATTKLIRKKPEIAQIKDYLSEHPFNPNNTRLKMLIGEIQVYESRSSIYYVNGLAAMTRDRRLRVEIYSPLGQTLILAVSDGKQFWFAEPRKKICRKLSLDSSKLYFPNVDIEIPVKMLFTFVAGYPFHIAPKTTTKWTEETDQGKVIWGWHNTRYLFENFDSKTPKALYYLDGATGFKQEFQRFDNDNGGLLVEKWQLKTTWRQKNKKLTWVWKNVDYEEEIKNPAMFSPPQLEACKGT